MNEHKSAQLFNDLLSGKSTQEENTPADVQPALEFARRLEQMDLSPASRQQARLLRRLVRKHPSRVPPRPRGQALGWVMSGAASFVVVAALVTVGLMVNRYYSEVRPQLSAEPLVIAEANPTTFSTSPAPDDLPRAAVPTSPAQPTPLPPSFTPTSEPITVTMEQAIEEAPFPILAPASESLPYELESVVIPTQEEDQPEVVVQNYRSGEDEVQITQSQVDESDVGTPPMKSTDEVEVRGQTGYWLTLNTGKRALYWEEGSTAVTVSGSLPDQEILALAETLETQGSATPVAPECAGDNPGLPGCSPESPLTGGRLVFASRQGETAGRMLVADLQSGSMWSVGKQAGRVLGWSSSGAYLLNRSPKNIFQVYDSAGNVVQRIPAEGPLDAFWLPQGVPVSGADWLALPGKSGNLIAVSVPSGEKQAILPDGAVSSPSSTPAVSADGWIAWTSDPSVLTEADPAQRLVIIRAGQPASLQAHLLSADVRSQPAYRIVSWAPGTRLLLLAGWLNNPALEAGGVPLYTFNVDTGQLSKLPATMLNTPEAFDWHPTRPGLMILAEGGVASIAENKRLALLDVTTGTIEYLILDETGAPSAAAAAFAPRWSPDGSRVAYASVQSPGESSAAGEETLGGRAIWIIDLSSKPYATRQVTALLAGEGVNVIDGWPHWSLNGKQLLYTRQRGGETEVRVLDLVTGFDVPLVTGLQDPACLLGGCGWQQMLLYNPRPAPPAAPKPSPTPTPTLTQATAEPTVSAWNDYTSPAFGFTFRYPAGWEVRSAGENTLQVGRGSVILTIGVKRAGDPAGILRTGLPAGNFVPQGMITFLGQEIERTALVVNSQVRTVLYAAASEIERIPLVFALSLDETSPEGTEITPEDLQAADQILQSFALLEPTSTQSP